MEQEKTINHKRKLFLPVIILLIVLGGGATMLLKSDTTGSQVRAATSQQTELNKPLATQIINKKLAFPLRDDKGKEVAKIQYIIENAELRNEIVVKGQKARAVQGKAFLIINLKMTNDFNQSIQINAKDYVRLVVNKSDEKLAPEIHNDPVEIQAISTKYTRVGFPINTTDKNIVLQVGEINGKKESFTLTLK